MERIFKIVSRSVDSGGICSGRASGVSPEMYVDGTESIPRCSRAPRKLSCSRAPRKLSSPPEWSLFTCTSTMCLLMVGMRREGTKQGGWERAGHDWVKRPCPNTATSKVPIFEDSLLDVACQGPPCVAFLSRRRLLASGPVCTDCSARPFCPCFFIRCAVCEGIPVGL